MRVLLTAILLAALVAVASPAECSDCNDNRLCNAPSQCGAGCQCIPMPGRSVGMCQ